MNWGDFEERVIDLKNEKQVTIIKQFLARFDLSFSAQVDYTIALYKEGKIAGTGSFCGEVLRNIAIDDAFQGEGLTATIVTKLITEASRRGIFHYFIFTKPDKAYLFSALGFNEVGRAEPYAVLLESGIGSIGSYCREIANNIVEMPEGKRAALVVNCNPFTLGHKAVITKAAAENDSVIVMVVSEEGSVFPFDVRFRLVKEGLAEFNNIAVVPGGKYVVSSATFPGYFTRGNETVTAQTRLDAEIFASRIAPELKISSRYVGDEPYCLVTRAYNEALTDILPQRGISVKIMDRITVNGEVISASRVRALIKDEKWAEISSLVPDTTYKYLISAEAKPIIDKVIHNKSRH
ncbi:[citrate (pro-3S)-lyase] ligase [Dendrosporobacter sp. 1207_IL3150]|uniref:[citrate (pro-3S)-lyase] ligase n=1 Tax=Dendrosporobacter sp. 1207_IL3150 TaxID=3084054 RepID=UPI002FD932CD